MGCLIYSQLPTSFKEENLSLFGDALWEEGKSLASLASGPCLYVGKRVALACACYFGWNIGWHMMVGSKIHAEEIREEKELKDELVRIKRIYPIKRGKEYQKKNEENRNARVWQKI